MSEKLRSFGVGFNKSARNLFYASNKQGPSSVAYVVSLMLNSLLLDFTKHSKWLRYGLIAHFNDYDNFGRSQHNLHNP